MTTDDETQLLRKVPTKLFIAGTWVDATSNRSIDVVDPATGLTLLAVSDASVADGLTALGAAVGAQHEWARTPPRHRSEILRRAFDLLQERADEFALLMTLEMGKPLREAHAEVTYGAEFLRWFSEEAPRICGRYGSTPEGAGRMVVVQRPVGPCFLITPWNFPLAMATRKIAPALAAGCTVVIKPSELTPMTTLCVAQLFADAGLPDGVLNVVTTSASAELSAPIIADSRLRKLSFTGSTSVGVRLLKQAAGTVLRTSMELGGNAPFLVFDDADLAGAADGLMQAKFRNIGEACTAANRILVHHDVAEEFAARMTARVAALVVGRGTEDGVTIGPLINANAVGKCESLVRDAVERGGSLRFGGSPIQGPGTFFPPTVVTDVPAGSALLHEEIFGPVLAITTFTDETDAIRQANDTNYGLASYVYTRDLARAQRMIEELETGMMGLNAGAISNAAAPFGGVKQSGLGREGGSEGIHEYLETKYVLSPSPFA